MSNLIYISLENDFVWDGFLRNDLLNEELIKIFCKNHTEYYENALKYDEYCNLILLFKDEFNNINKYDVLINSLNDIEIRKIINND